MKAIITLRGAAAWEPGLPDREKDAAGRESRDMRKINTRDIQELVWSSPKWKFGGAGIEISEALGRIPQSTDLKLRHPFDVEILRLTAGQTPYPYHSHSAQWEFYHVISGKGVVRHEEGTMTIEAGDAFIFEPGRAHQLSNDGTEDLVVYVVADNPLGESHYYPDSGKWGVGSPERTILRSARLDYFDGEE
jgi:mannose-6-phosphate isomerase-like protein (cupin superfamily)